MGCHKTLNKEAASSIGKNIKPPIRLGFGEGLGLVFDLSLGLGLVLG